MILFIVLVIFTALLTMILIRHSKWKLDNPDYLERVAEKYVAKKRANRDRRNIDKGYDPERRMGDRPMKS